MLRSALKLGLGVLYLNTVLVLLLKFATMKQKSDIGTLMIRIGFGRIFY